jgi:hypothetical protein
MENASGFTQTIGDEHRHIDPEVDMPHADSSLHERVFKRKTAPQEETHQIFAPAGLEIIHLGAQHPITVDTIARDIRPNISAWGELAGLRVPRVKHFEERTGLRIALAKKQEIVGQGARYHYQIGLRIARGQPSSRPPPLAGANTMPYVLRCQSSQIM